MSTINWLANLSGARHRRRPLRSVLMPPRPMPPQIAAHYAELLAERKRLGAGDLLRDEFAAASVDFMLSTQDALHERELAVLRRWNIVLSTALVIVSTLLVIVSIALTAATWPGPL